MHETTAGAHDLQVDKGSVPTIESFFGEPLSAALLRAVSGTPLEQLLHLANDIRKRQNTISDQLRRRRVELEHAPSTVRDLRLASGLSQFRHSQLTIQEELYFDGQTAYAITQSNGFKHWYMYSDSLVLPDPAFNWASMLINEWEAYGALRLCEADEQAAIRSAVEYLLKLMPMLSAGGLTLLPDKDAIDPTVDTFDADFPLAQNVPLSMLLDPDVFLSTLLWGDPYLASVVASMDIIPAWQRTALKLDDPRDVQELVSGFENLNGLVPRFPEIWQRAHPEAPLLGTRMGRTYSAGSFRAALGLATLQRQTSLVPAPVHEVSRRHLLRTTGISLEGVNRPSLLADELGLAAMMQVPDLSGISLGDLVSLRSDEQTFNRVREGFRELAAVVSQSDDPSYRSLQATVAEAAEDLLSPLYDELTAEVRKRSAFATLIGWGVKGAVNMGFSGIAGLISGPVGGLVSRSSGVSGAASKFASKKVREVNGPKEVARSLIISALPADRNVI